MSDYFVGEIRMFAGNAAPANWAFCDGQLLSISDAQALFSLIGTTYGGDGQTNFAVPDLRGRVPLHQGDTFKLAEAAGVETVALTEQQLPAHTHPLMASLNNAGANVVTNNVTGQVGASQIYREVAPGSLMSKASLGSFGSGQPQPHTNIQPYLAVNFIIALAGSYPQQN